MNVNDTNPVTTEDHKRRSIWDKIDYTLVAAQIEAEVTPENVEAAQKQKQAWRRIRPVLDLVSTVFWVYVILQVFFVDVDSAIFGPYASYRFFFFVAVAVWLVLTIRKTWPIIATFAYWSGRGLADNKWL